MALPYGVCSICLREADLTKEHVPPASAFNDRTVIAYDFETALRIEPWDAKPWARRGGIVGTPIKGGAGYNRLCDRCNNALCSPYATEYGRWAKQAATLFGLIGARSLPHPLFFGYPSRFMKQVVAMMLVTGGSSYTQRNYDLRRFVMEKSCRFMGAGVRVFAYFNTSSKGRSEIEASKGDGEAALSRFFESNFTDTAGMSTFSEFSKFPFGFVLTRNSPPPDERLREITVLARHGYNDYTASLLPLLIFPVVTPVCGDFFTPREAALAMDPTTGPAFFSQLH